MKNNKFGSAKRNNWQLCPSVNLTRRQAVKSFAVLTVVCGGCKIEENDVVGAVEIFPELPEALPVVCGTFPATFPATLG